MYTSGTSGSSYQLACQTQFLYDGWNCIAETDSNNNLTKSYLWGSDLSGSVSGAGGVGGLLALTDHTSGSNAGPYLPRYDGNGNVVALVSGTSGGAVARYVYGPFGEVIRASGPMAGVNPIKFSTDYTDIETGLDYYGYRYYSPDGGRWINRDPIEEQGGPNLYSFCGNDGVNRIDVHGLDDIWPTQQIVNNFLLGRGPNSYTFYNGESWTEAMKWNPEVRAVRYTIQQKLIADYKAGVTQDQGPVIYNLSQYYNEFGLMLDAANHIFWWLTNGYGGQNDWNVNGSFRGQWTATITNACTADVHFHLNDVLSASSLTHISYNGPIQSVLPNNPLGPHGPMGNVNIDWFWGWKVNYRLNGLYILKDYKE